MLNIRKNMGEKMEFSTPHRAAQREIAAISLVVKHVIFLGNTNFKKSNTELFNLYVKH